MTKEETKKILQVLRISYPNSFKNLSDEDTFLFLDLWSEAFANDDVREVIKAVKSIIYSDTREFAPNIAKVKNEMFKKYEGQQISVDEAWNMVVKSAKCDYSRAKRCFDELPVNVQKAVGSPNYLMELGYMNKDSLEFKKRDFEKSMKSVLEDEKEKVIRGEMKAEYIPISNGKNQIDQIAEKQQTLLITGNSEDEKERINKLIEIAEMKYQIGITNEVERYQEVTEYERMLGNGTN